MKSIAVIILFVISLSYASSAQESACDYKVEVLVEGEEFEKEDFTWRMKATKIEGGSTNITGTAEIQDSSGKTVKTYKPWTSESISRQKTSSEYTPNLKEGQEYKITAEIDVECDDTSKDNNVDVKTIKIKGEKEETENDDASDTETDAKSDDTASTEAENNEEIKPKTIQKAKATNPTTNEEAENVIQLTKNTQNQELQSTAAVIQAPQIVYESSNERIKDLIMIFLLALSILLNIILIWRR